MKLAKVLAGTVIGAVVLTTAACGGGSGSFAGSEAIQCVDTAGNVWDDDYCEPDESEFNSSYYFVGVNSGNVYPPGEYDGDSDHKKKSTKTTAKKAAPVPSKAAATTAKAAPTPTKAAPKTTAAKPTQKAAPTTKKK